MTAGGGPKGGPALRAEPGTYALILRPEESLEERGPVRIGKLGALELEAGHYVYVGSAFGPGGLRARVGHHRRPVKNRHWHIDHLLPAMELRAVWYTYNPVKREEEWARALRSMPGASNPMAGFGAGDCGCEGHLFLFDGRPSVERFRERAHDLAGEPYAIQVEAAPSG